MAMHGEANNFHHVHPSRMTLCGCVGGASDEIITDNNTEVETITGLMCDVGACRRDGACDGAARLERARRASVA
jgi:hypothetical protein